MKNPFKKDIYLGPEPEVTRMVLESQRLLNEMIGKWQMEFANSTGETREITLNLAEFDDEIKEFSETPWHFLGVAGVALASLKFLLGQAPDEVIERFRADLGMMVLNFERIVVASENRNEHKSGKWAGPSK